MSTAGSRKRVLITGANGFVGANLVKRMLDRGHEVHCISRSGLADWRLAEEARNFSIHRCDLLDQQEIARVVHRVAADWIFHLATYGGNESENDPQRIIATNVSGTVNIALAAADVGFEVFINTGSSSEYGFKDMAPSEVEWLEPNSFYGVGKAAATLFCRTLARKRSLRMTTLRLYSVYGPYEDPSRLIPTTICSGYRGGYPPFADRATSRDFVHVDDVMNAFEAVAICPGNPGTIYNVGSGVGRTLSEVAETSRRAFRLSGEPQWGDFPARQWDTTVWVANISAITAATGWGPRVAFEEGFQAMFQWITADPGRLKWYLKRSGVLENA